MERTLRIASGKARIKNARYRPVPGGVFPISAGIVLGLAGSGPVVLD